MNSLEALFPQCTLDDCPQRGTEHKHILPKQQAFLDSAAKYVALVGGYQSSKTTVACILCHLLCVNIPGNRGIVIRRSYSKLEDSTLRIFMEVLERSGIPLDTPSGIQYFDKRNNWPHRFKYPNGAELLFRESKDLGRFLGPQYGFFYIDEAQEEPEKSFKDLIGRLSLPVAKHHLKGIVTTNPPSQRHWVAVRWPKPGRNGSFEMWRVSSRENPFLPTSYVSDLEKEHTPSEVQRIIEGEYGFVYEGRPVYMPPFVNSKHVGEPEVNDGFTLVRSWDFGFRCPVVTWHQYPRCKFGRTHWVVAAEKAGHDIEAEAFADEVLAYHKKTFPNHRPLLILDVGDRAGKQRTDKGPGPMARLTKPPWRLTFRSKYCSIQPGIDLIRKALRMDDCKCGRPIFVMHRRCRSTMEAFMGGYHLPKEVPGKEPKDEPVKDGYYDNFTDTVRYAGENVYRNALLPDFDLDVMMAENPGEPRKPDRNEWMGATILPQ